MNKKVFAINRCNYLPQEYFETVFPGSTWDDSSESFTMPDGRIFDTFVLDVETEGCAIHRDIEFRQIVQYFPIPFTK